MRVGGLFVATGEPAWMAAVVVEQGRLLDSVVISRQLRAEYQAGLLALREGPLLQAAADRLKVRPDVLVVNASGRDHPRRAGLALHLGAACGSPSIGVTDRPLVATGPEPSSSQRGAVAEMQLDGELVGYRLRTRADTRAVVVHAGWRTSPLTALKDFLSEGGESRTPEPIRSARRFARTARADHTTAIWSTPAD